uniref:Uncharacterized protein n=1 Tax=Phlebotomus papatasi TaxID=29031 RepID=A0A1B0D4E7_PHLPP
MARPRISQSRSPRRARYARNIRHEEVMRVPFVQRNNTTLMNNSKDSNHHPDGQGPFPPRPSPQDEENIYW